MASFDLALVSCSVSLYSRREGLDGPHRHSITDQIELDAIVRIERNAKRSLLVLGRIDLLDAKA
jgi:hypothetical protein